MTQFGKIQSYDSGLGEGWIIPNRGGDALPFGKADLRRESQQPLAGQAYSFTPSDDDGNGKRATDLDRLSDAKILRMQSGATMRGH
ncbi:cold-shock protein [Aurantiacibacter sp. D1-12]|uniref:cold-shock protein n=1 Tax=Aurantiacibacter sp. D1-12 TaxID=2993658 RepID=UPI00237CC88C|nr:cold-shock protein [Aurantiacibacter sp. D1-12]MDE1468454.1 cold-shock protein [Aurantiacibacter sp. D1-12]